MLLGVLGAISVFLSAAPTPLRWILAVLAMAEGVRLARREGARAPVALRFAVDGSLRVGPDHAALRYAEVRVRVQGRTAWLRARDGQGRSLRLAWWPDTLAGGAGRVLRLAAAGGFGPAKRARPSSFATMPG